MRIWMAGIGLLALAGCGVSETAVTAAAGAASKAEEAKAAQQTQARVEAQLQGASRQAEQRLQQAE
jgi:hypothetical protein